MSGAGGAKAGAAAAAASYRYRPGRYWFAQRTKTFASRLWQRRISRAGGATDYRGVPRSTPYTFNIVRGDTVEVTSAGAARDADKGRILRDAAGHVVPKAYMGLRGVVLKVLRLREQVVVSGVNMRTRVVQPSAESTGFFAKVESPIPYSQIALIDPSTGQAARGRVKRVRREKGAPKERVVVATKAVVPFPLPKVAKVRTQNVQTDTHPEDVLAVSYTAPAQLRTTLAQTDEEGRARTDEQGHILLQDESLELRAARIRF